MAINKSRAYFNLQCAIRISFALRYVYYMCNEIIVATVNMPKPPGSIKMLSFTIRKRAVHVVKTGYLRQYTVYLRSVFSPYETILSGAELHTVLYPYGKRLVFGRFLLLYGSNTVSRIIRYCRSKWS